MKKILTRIICGALALCMLLSMTACAKSDWGGATMTEGGKLKALNGFVAETDNYVYFINGVANNTEDNTFGAPVHGALVVADKSDLSKSEVVVPKLFASTDYKQGLFIYDNYVYYGTPNIEKNSSGNIANSEMTFMRTSLDGKKSDKYLTLSALSAEYRFVEKDGTVYIVYYDSVDTALKVYNTSLKTEEIIAKTDAKAERISLNAYKFISGNSVNDAVVIYTVTLYSKEYDESKAEIKDYQRPSESYNMVYAYTVGDTKAEGAEVIGKVIYDGKNDEANAIDDAMYEIKLVKGGYVFVKETVNSKVKTFAVKLDSANFVEKTLILNDKYLEDKNIIESLDEVYVLDAGVVYKTNLKKKDNATKRKVAINEKISTMLFVKSTENDGKDLYYYNSANELAKMALRNIKGDGTDIDVSGVHEIRLSSSTVSTTWFRPVNMKIADKDYLFYVDNSAQGANYVKYIVLSDIDFDKDILEKDTDDEDKKNDVYYLDTAKEIFIGKMTKKDSASVMSAKINDISSKLENGVLPLEEVKKDGKVVSYKSDLVASVKKEYDDLDKEIKDLVDEKTVKTLDNYIEAIRISNIYVKLDGIEKCDTEESASAFKPVYEGMKADIEAFMKQENAGTVQGYIQNNLKAHYSHAKKLFEPKEEKK